MGGAPAGGGGGTDSDSDGIEDSNDNCPGTANADQANADGDDYGDVCDNCPNTSNNSQTNSDGDTLGDACDNCPSVDNEDQANADGDSAGDTCDNCPADVNDDQADVDTDGVGDVCDNCPNDANADQADSDTDGVGDACESAPPPDPDVSITSGNSPIDENGGVSTITVTLSEAHTSQDVTVNFGTGGTFEAGDYTLSDTSVTILQGSTQETVTVTAHDDADTDDEVVVVSINTATNANIVSPDTYSVTITDDDAAPTMHVAALMGNATGGPFWDAKVTITVVDGDGNAIEGAAVSGVWDLDGSTGSCTTNASGKCDVKKIGISPSVSSITFTVAGVAKGSYEYKSDENVQTSITVDEP